MKLHIPSRCDRGTGRAPTELLRLRLAAGGGGIQQLRQCHPIAARQPPMTRNTMHARCKDQSGHIPLSCIAHGKPMPLLRAFGSNGWVRFSSISHSGVCLRPHPRRSLGTPSPTPGLPLTHLAALCLPRWRWVYRAQTARSASSISSGTARTSRAGRTMSPGFSRKTPTRCANRAVHSGDRSMRRIIGESLCLATI